MAELPTVYLQIIPPIVQLHSKAPGSVWPGATRHRAQTRAMLAARLQTSLERTHSTPLLPPAIHPQPISSNFPVLGGVKPAQSSRHTWLCLQIASCLSALAATGQAAETQEGDAPEVGQTRVQRPHEAF